MKEELIGAQITDIQAAQPHLSASDAEQKARNMVDQLIAQTTEE